MKLTLIMTLIATLFSFNAFAGETNADHVPSIVKEKATLMAQLPIAVIGGTLKLAGKTLEVGGEMVVRLADGTRVLVTHLGKGAVAIAKLGVKALKFTIKLAKRGVMYTLHAAKWVITKAFKGAVYVAKKVGKALKPVLKFALKGTKVVVTTALKLPAAVLRSLGGLIEGIIEGIFGRN